MGKPHDEADEPMSLEEMAQKEEENEVEMIVPGFDGKMVCDCDCDRFQIFSEKKNDEKATFARCTGCGIKYLLRVVG